MTKKTGESVIVELGKDFEKFFLSYAAEILNRESVPELTAPALYSLQAGGKRIRPVLVLLCANCMTADVASDEALLTAGAVECIHTYSLIHDDLPAMDDDDMRRGRPSCHKRYPQWAAILAGDTLNTFAFRLLADAGGNVGAKVRLLADAGGHAGMAAGQGLDLSREKGDFPVGEGSVGFRGPGLSESLLALFRPVHTTEEGRRLLAIHMHKTGALIRSSCELGALCNGVDPRRFSDFGTGLGLLFQITDDILDIIGQSDRLGKTIGKDEASGKLTFPALIGLEGSQELARSLARLTIEQAEQLPVSDDVRRTLVDLVNYILLRDH